MSFVNKLGNLHTFAILFITSKSLKSGTYSEGELESTLSGKDSKRICEHILKQLTSPNFFLMLEILECKKYLCFKE